MILNLIKVVYLFLKYVFFVVVSVGDDWWVYLMFFIDLFYVGEYGILKVV